MNPKNHVALALADTFLAGEADIAGLIRSATWALGKKWRWIAPLCRALHKHTGEHFYHFSRRELADLILAHKGFSAAWKPDREKPLIRRYCLERPVATEKSDWLDKLDLPDLATSADLAQWLDISPSELDWFADQWRTNSVTPSALQHYLYRWVAKRSGGLRLIEIPKLRLREIQRKILRQLLDRVPPHPAAHGFRRAHSCLSHAALHVGKPVLVRMDLKHFFPSIPAARIHALFSKLAYSHNVAGLLARLCSHRTPSRVYTAPQIRQQLPVQDREMLRARHLTQGSPSSPAIANLCAYRLDLRLDALAKSLNATYSRYADDLAFSGDGELARALQRFHVQVGAIALEEGFAINTLKTRVMRAGVRQQLTGIVVNQHANIPRKEFDTLKAILTNCIRHGPDSQNRAQHRDFAAYLTGKVVYVQMVNPQRGGRLRGLLDQIQWVRQP